MPRRRRHSLRGITYRNFKPTKSQGRYLLNRIYKAIEERRGYDSPLGHRTKLKIGNLEKSDFYQIDLHLRERGAKLTADDIEMLRYGYKAIKELKVDPRIGIEDSTRIQMIEEHLKDVYGLTKKDYQNKALADDFARYSKELYSLPPELLKEYFSNSRWWGSRRFNRPANLDHYEGGFVDYIEENGESWVLKSLHKFKEEKGLL